MRFRILLPLLLVTAGFAQEQAAFAFANQKGKALLTISPESFALNQTEATLFDTAMCDDGRRYEVLFERTQPSAPGDNGRALAQNFERYAGYRFQVVKGRIPADSNCLTARRHFFEERKPLPMTSWAAPKDVAGKNPPACSAETRAALPLPEERAVIGCAELATIGSDARLLAVEYERRGDQKLGAVALVLPARVLLVKYPASASTTTAWRVDDEGRWQPGGFVPLFAFERLSDHALEIAVQWGGAEGANLLLYRVQGDVLQPVDFGYRYWAPL